MKTQRELDLAAVWRGMHRDFKGKGADGVKRVMIWRRGTALVPLDSLTEAEIDNLLNRKAKA